MRSAFTRTALVAALATLPTLGHALSGITDLKGDLLPTFAGSASSTDLDVLSATVLYDPLTDLFKITATMAGNIGTTATGLYVWGVNRGAGVASFAANGIDGVRFDRVVLVRPNGTANIAGGAALPAGSVTISGATISAVVSGKLLPSTGFANKIDYTWNLWPRDASLPAGFTQIADFAPDNSNFTSTQGVVAVPEPGTLAMMFGGVALLAFARRRGRA